MEQLKIRAYGKINLTLDILGRRLNGYHDLRMVMQQVELADDITLQKIPEGIRIVGSHRHMPADESNLAVKAARLMFDEYQLPGGLSIAIDKKIPVAGGMAGGSADAAALLRGIDELYDLGLTTEQLRMLGLRLGADVPYCIQGGTMLAEGIGEVLSALPPMPACWVALARPPFGVSTAWVYGEYDRQPAAGHPQTDELIAGLKEQNLTRIAAALGNVLEQVTVRRYPVISRIRDLMRSAGAYGAMMTGSGPTVFGLFEKKADAQAALAGIRKQGLAKETHLTRIHNEGSQTDEHRF